MLGQHFCANKYTLENAAAMKNNRSWENCQAAKIHHNFCQLDNLSWRAWHLWETCWINKNALGKHKNALLDEMGPIRILFQPCYIMPPMLYATALRQRPFCRSSFLISLCKQTLASAYGNIVSSTF